jgi:hypothetical protein
MTWFVADNLGYYWIDVQNNLPTQKPPAGNMPSRPMLPFEELHNSFMDLGDGTRYYYYRVLSPTTPTTPTTPTKSLSKFPDLPTYIILMDKLLAGENFDNQGTTVKLLKIEGVFISYHGSLILCYQQDNEILRFCSYKQSAPPKEWYQKYLGTRFTVSSRNGFLGIENKTMSWLPIVDNMSINFLTNQMYNFTEFVMKKYYLRQRFLQEYLNQITPEYITRLAARHSIYTKCHGCSVRNLDHLETHLQRKELTLFLILAIFDFDGANAQKRTRDFIEIMRSSASISHKNDICQTFRDLTATFFKAQLTYDYAPDVPEKGQTKNSSFDWGFVKLPSTKKHTGPLFATEVNENPNIEEVSVWDDGEAANSPNAESWSLKWSSTITLPSGELLTSSSIDV